MRDLFPRLSLPAQSFHRNGTCTHVQPVAAGRRHHQMLGNARSLRIRLAAARAQTMPLRSKHGGRRQSEADTRLRTKRLNASRCRRGPRVTSGVVDLVCVRTRGFMVGDGC